MPIQHYDVHTTLERGERGEDVAGVQSRKAFYVVVDQSSPDRCEDA